MPTVNPEATVQPAAVDDRVAAIVAAAARVPSVDGRRTLRDLGFDSLALVELALALEEQTGHTITDGDLQPDMTVDDVRAAVDGTVEDRLPRDNHASVNEQVDVEQPLWPYTWGRIFRWAGAPFDLLYRFAVTEEIVLGEEHVERLPNHVVFAGTHRSYADVLSIRSAISQSIGRERAHRLVVPAASVRVAAAGPLATYAILAFGLYPLRQYAHRDASLRGLARVAESGSDVLIFPQGKHVDSQRERNGDESARFRTGVYHLARALDVPVIPFGIAGSERLIPPAPPPGFKGWAIAGIPVTVRRGPLAVAFGAPMAPAASESPEQFAARLEATCFALARSAEATTAGKATVTRA